MANTLKYAALAASLLVMPVLAANQAQAQQLIINDNMEIEGGEYNGIRGSAPVILSETSNNGEYWHLNINGDVVLKNSYVGIGTFSGFRVTTDGKLSVNGASDGSNTININGGNATVFYAVTTYGNGALDINNMNINISDYTPSSSSSLTGIMNQGTMNIKGVAAGTNSVVFTNNKPANVLMAVANNGSAHLSFENMNIIINNNNPLALLGLNNSGYLNIKGVEAGTNIIQINNNTTTSNSFAGISNSSYSGIFNIENMNIDMSGNSSTEFNGINNTGSLTIKGVAEGSNSIVMNDNYGGSKESHGIINTGNMHIENMNFYIQNLSSDVKAYGIQNSKILDIIGSQDRNVMVFNGIETAAFKTTSSYATTNIKNMDIFVDGSDFFHVRDGANVNIDNSTARVTSEDTGFLVGYQNANINLTNSTVLTQGGPLMHVSPESTYSVATGNLNLNNSIASGHIITEGQRGSSNLSLENNSIWLMSNDSNVTNIKNNNSIIDLRSSTGGFNTLTVKDYVGNGGTIILGTQLGDDNSLTDKLVIDGGSATGNTLLEVINLGGFGAETINGIKIVDAINGSTIAEDAFALKGGVVDSTGYEYALHQGDEDGIDDQSMFLRSTKKLTNTSMTMANIPALSLSIAKAGMNSLSKRMGELRNSDSADVSGVWARSYAKKIRVNDYIATDMDIYGFEAGVDRRFDINKDNKIFLGVMAGHMETSNIRTKQSTGGVGSGNGSAPSIGAYATWLHTDGWFVDFAARHFWEDFDLTSYSSAGNAIKYSPNRQVTSLSIEAGKKTEYKIDDTSSWFIEPSVEMGYSWAGADSFRTNNFNKVYYGKTESLTSKVSIKSGYKKLLDNGMILEPYLQASVIQEWDGKTKIRHAEADFNSDLSGTSFEFGAGLNAKLNDKVSLYGDIMYEKGSKIEALSGNLGLRYSF